MSDAADAAAGRLEGRRVLVIAHDFPPIRSPQAVRALAFVRELHRWKAEVHVLTRTCLRGLPEPVLPDGVRVWRASAGPYESLVDAVASRRRNARASRDAGFGEGDPTGPTRLNWKGKSVRLATRIMALILFPDDRVAWVPAARRTLRRILAESRPDVALVMHEPAAGLVLAKALRPLDIPWLADIADPVLAGYTPWHWRRLAHRLEGRVMVEASAMTVTNEATADLLKARHPYSRIAIEIVPQGFDPQVAPPMETSLPLRLAYTGRFYAFRPAGQLLQALAMTPGIEIHIAGPEMPADVLEAAMRHPQKIRLHGEVDHARALALQRDADVLVNIGNRGTVQTPGKIYEYFGIPRPVLHLYADAQDPVPALLEQRRRGLSTRNDAAAIRATLEQLVALKRDGRLQASFDLSAEVVEEFAWQHLGRRMAGLLAGIARRP